MIRQRNTDPSLDRLRALPMLAGWDDSELTLLALDAHVLWLRKPYQLVREGEVPRECYLLLNGHGEVSGGGRPSYPIGPGALVAAHALLTATPSPVSVVTTEPARVLAFGPAALQRIEQRAADTSRPAAMMCG